MDNVLSFAGQSNKWNTADDAANVVEAINNHKNLEVLDLENNTLGPDAAKVIGDALANHPEFLRAKFKDLFTGRLKTEIPLALKHLFSGINRAGAKIIELDLSDNALGPVGVEGMVDFMSSESCYTLEELRLNNNGLGITGGKMLAESLNKLVDNSNRDGHPWKLKVFIAGRNRLEKVGAKVYAALFERLGSLEELVMPQNGIFHEGIAALAEALSKNPNIRVLNLNDNTFTKKGAEAMAKYLPSMPNLEVINFGDCLIKNSGVAAIARSLMNGHEKLKELNVDSNELTIQGGLSITEAMQNKPQLSKLSLDGNMFGDEGKEVIEQFLGDIGLLEILVPLEENLDPDSEEEEEDSESSELSEIEVVHVSDCTEKTAQQIQAGEKIKGPFEATKCTGQDYLSSPCPALLLGLSSVEDLKAAAAKGCQTPDQEITSILKILVRTAVMAHTTDFALSTKVTETVKSLAERIFTIASANQLVSFTTNSLLVHLGLMKCEDSKFCLISEQAGILSCLVSLVNEPFFPQDTKNTLSYFLSRPTTLNPLPTEAKTNLISALKK